MKEEYYAATSDEGPYHFGPYEDKETLRQDALVEFADEIAEGEMVHIGKGRKVQLRVDGDTTLDSIINECVDDLYEDALSNWPKNLSKEATSDLGNRLTEVFQKWCVDNNQEFEFTVIDAIETI